MLRCCFNPLSGTLYNTLQDSFARRCSAEDCAGMLLFLVVNQVPIHESLVERFCSSDDNGFCSSNKIHPDEDMELMQQIQQKTAFSTAMRVKYYTSMEAMYCN